MIKYCSILFCVWLCALSGALNAQVIDDFSDGDFTTNPEWVGDNALFAIDTYPGGDNLMLRSNSPGEADYYLSTPSSIVSETSWSFFFDLQFGTSGVNFFDAFLVADNADLSLAENGYFLRFGRTQDDITFWKRTSGTDELLIDGADGQIGSSSQNPFGVKVTRDENGLWSVNIDQGATGSYLPLGVITDTDITTAVAFGFFIVQSGAASPVNNHWFDAVEVAIVLPDTTPPELLSATPTSATAVLVSFNEALGNISAESTANYNLTPGVGEPVTATLQANLTDVVLEFGSPMQNGIQYTLSVTGVEDVSGNAMTTDDASFLFVIPETAAYKDVVFNEIMADPTPAVASIPEQEYLEIYNASDKYLELENWTLVNTTTAKNLPAHLLEPGGYVILCNTNYVSSFEPYGDVLGIPSFIALANATDSLTLLDDSGTLIDVVVYFDSWYGDPDKAGGGWALELINPETPCSGSQNWTASNDPSGGTPNAQNSVNDTTPDTAPPELTGFSISDPLNLTLFFNEPLDPGSISSTLVTVEPDLGVAGIAMNPDLQSISVTFDNPIDTAVYYTVFIEGVADCIGNPIAPGSSIAFVIGYSPQQYDVLINELMADPTPEVGLPNHEYIELYNTTDKLFDLSSCNLAGYAFPNNTFLEPQSHLLIISDAGITYPNAESVAVLGMSSTFLTNSGKEVILTNVDGTVVDRVSYTIDWYRDATKNSGGWSLERINPEEPCRAGDNWRASVHQSGGTPGFLNSVHDLTPDAQGPELLTILVIDPVTIELVFDEVLGENSVISAGYSFEPSLTVFDMEIVAPENQRIRLMLAEILVPNQRHEIEIIGLTDCSGNEFVGDGVTEFGLPAAPTEGNLIINEVLFNARTGGASFVEIYNNSDAIISLKDWQLGNLDNGQQYPITGESYVLFPGEFLAVTSNRQNVHAEYPLSPYNRIYQASNIPTLNNSDGKVVLVAPDGSTIDRFDYLQDYHFELLNTVKGVSLERISYDRPASDPTNWTSAAEAFNWATPGFENSQFQSVEPSNDEVSVFPEVFSPDNDGHQDVMNIKYKFEKSALAGNITIYDSSGREVRKLMRNELLGTDGVISWDGIGDHGERARVGVHIIYMEVFAPDGWTKAFKLSCVVASQL